MLFEDWKRSEKDRRVYLLHSLRLTLFFFRVPTPFHPLNRSFHSPALVHPEALHFFETFSLGIQIKQLIWESHISCCYLHKLLRVPTPLEYTYTRFILWPSSVVYSIRYFQTSHLSFVTDLHLTVTRPECVTTLTSLSLFRSSWSHFCFCFVYFPIGLLVRILRESWLSFSQWCFSSIV
jgi:hypothetical protein